MKNEEMKNKLSGKTVKEEFEHSLKFNKFFFSVDSKMKTFFGFCEWDFFHASVGVHP